VSALIDGQARRRGDQLLYRFLRTGDVDGATQEWTFADLDHRSRAVGAVLQDAGAAGERALLVYPPGLEFIEGFMGCLRAGVIAVPTYPPDPARLDRTLPRLRAIAQDSGARYVLTTRQTLAMAAAILPAAPQLAALRWIATDDLTPAHADAFRAPALGGDDLAFLQYTSGSTGDPKGVMVTNANVIHNERAIAQAFRHDERSRVVGWLPLFHDMGLVGNVLQPLFCGIPCTLMSPLAFLQRPLRWLHAVSHFGGTSSGGPNFAYELCVRKVRPEDRARLDLRSWTMAFNGAEPIRERTLARFAEAFAEAGFRREAFYPCYGLAESTLIVTGAGAQREPVIHAFSASALERGRAELVAPDAGGAPEARALVSSGQAALDQRIAVVDPATGSALPDGGVGEIFVASPSVARGYWERPEETARAFGATLASGEGPFLRTGDLGFLWRGELFVTGRLKDLIIIRGRNHAPQDLEQTVEAAHAAVRGGCVAAFALQGEGADAEEQLGIAAEVDAARAGGDLAAVAAAIQRAIAEVHGLAVAQLALLAPAGISKTSSGKIQRRATRAALAAGALPVLLAVASAGDAGDASPPEEGGALALRDALVSASPAARAQLLLDAVRGELGRELGRAPDQLDAEATAAAHGLDSLGMLAVEGRLEGMLDAPLPSALLWQAPSLEAVAQELARCWSARWEGGAPAPDVATGAAAADDRAAGVSSGQARLWFLDRLLPDSAVYNVATAVRLAGPLDHEALARALAALLARHAVLRTTFVADDAGAPRAVIAPPAAVALPVADLRATPAAERERALQDVASAERGRPFDLAVGPLVRCALARLAEDDHALLLTLHHTVTDGWSMGVLLRELAALYREARGGAAAALPAAASYADYVRQSRASSGGLARQRAFWSAKLAGLPRLELPIARARAGAPSARGATVHFELPAEVVARGRAIARDAGTTLFATLLAAFTALLHRYSGQADFGVGTVVANRARPEHRGLVGFLANTVVLRVDASADPTFLQLVERSRLAVSEALAHAELPFDEVVRASRAAADADHNPLFQAAFLMESLPPVDLDVPGMRWCPALDVPDASVADTAKFDLALMMSEPDASGRAALACQYSTDRFSAGAIERLVEHFGVLTQALCAEPARPVSTQPLLTPGERERVLVAWNATAMDYPRDATIHHLVAAQVQRTPDALAVTFDDASLTYAALDRRARHLAAQLAAAGVRPGDRVGLYLERSLELAVGLLGILTAGAAYVPLDPAYPAERVRYVLADAAVSAIVTQGHLAVDLPAGDAATPSVPVLELDAEAEPAAPPAAGPAAPSVGPRGLAYVMYTSGSTGRPKGVMIEHGAVVSFFAAMDARIDAGPAGVFLALTSVAFDISVLELLWTLTRGFQVVIHPEQRATALRAERAAPAPAFSLFYFADDDERSGDRYRLLLEGARFADDHGFLAVWTPERHFHAFGGLYPNPAVTGAAIAAATRRVGIRAGSVVLPLHHPLRVAEEWSLVDNLSGGRVGVSFASGWNANDFVLAPARYAGRREAMLEGIAQVRALWRGEPARLPNGDGTPIDVRIRPRPVQRELPVWLTAAGNPDTFRQAGELGANVLTHLLGQGLGELRDKIAVYREARRQAGHPGPGHVTLMLHTFVHRDPAVVRAAAAEPFRRYLKSSVDLMRGFGRSMGIDVDDAAFTDADLDALVHRAHERFFETSGLFGTPQACAAMVGRIEEIGVDEIACLIDFGVATEDVLASLPYLDALRRRAQRRRPTPRTVPEQITAHGVTHLQCTPSLAQALLLDPGAPAALAGLRALLVGGEALPAPLAARLDEAAPGRVINMYGPTETTIWSSTHAVRSEDGAGSVVAIGRPIGNTAMYVLDARREPVPIGVAGELYIGGAGLARGYHGRPELTAERFIGDPFRGGDARMYRTGDLARYRDDGTLEFVGRVDQQVKLRGFRIELGEIEATLAEHPAVHEVAVAVREERAGDQRLVAYVVPRGAAPPDADELRRLARARLPDYMVPAAVVLLPAMPLTPNGKLDRKALPALAGEARASARPYTAARTDDERAIAEIWAAVLGVPRVGMDDNFFDLGGHSLLLAQVHAQLRARVRADLPLVKLIEHPTVGALARYLSEAPDVTAAAAARAAQDRARLQTEALRRQQQRRPPR
jgi:natural product biosynthesis luciferase-like monooxygenase protein